MSSLHNDVDAGERARALHRVVRAMHDGECPDCHKIHRAEAMEQRAIFGALIGHACPSCGFQLSADESAAALQEFAPYMTRNLLIFEEGRLEREAKRIE